MDLLQTEKIMKRHKKNMNEKKVNYILEMDGKIFLVENVPARVDEETGEQLFAPSTVERLRKTILKRSEKPKRFTETPVYDFSE